MTLLVGTQVEVAHAGRPPIMKAESNTGHPPTKAERKRAIVRP
jgi:hypothetical protein